MNKQKRASCCEQCSYYDYDEYSEEYICSANMDEDEFMRFISGPGSYCPYFDPYDEYKIVSRQNWCFTLANRKKCVILFKKINSENAVTKTVGIYDAPSAESAYCGLCAEISLSSGAAEKCSRSQRIRPRYGRGEYRLSWNRVVKRCINLRPFFGTGIFFGIYSWI